MRMSRRSDQAFTVVEVIVAALVVTVVFAGAMYFVVGAGKSQQKTLVRQRMAATADAVSQMVRTDRAWLTDNTACGTDESKGCTFTSDKPDFPFKQQAAASKGPKLDTTVTIRPVDSDSDGRGPGDEDGITPDYFHIRVVVTLDPGEIKEWGQQTPFEALSTVDATALGRAIGALVIQTGETTNQVDERMAISHVRDSTDELKMGQQPECTSPFPISQAEWWDINRRPVLPLGCNEPLTNARAKFPMMGNVNVRGVNTVDFTIKRDGSDGGPTTTLKAKDAVYTPGGTYTFAGLPAGTYSIVPTLPADREVWPTKMVPSDGRASVQANQEARALIMVRPFQGVGTYKVQFTRDVHIYGLSTTSKTFVTDYSEGGANFEIRTTYVYLVPTGPVKRTYAGPAWSGIISMEPKPFDRYRDGSGSVSQLSLAPNWTATDLFQASGSHPYKDGIWTFEALPTGLHSSPKQQEKPTNIAGPDIWGEFDADDVPYGRNGTRKQDCYSALTPGGSCGDFAWISHQSSSIGKPNGAIRYHSPEGECYLDSNVSQYPVDMALQLGGEHADRCSRDFRYKNIKTGEITQLANFFPDKNGVGGRTMVLSMTQVTICVSGPGDCPGRQVTSGDESPAPDGTNTGKVGGDPPIHQRKPNGLSYNKPITDTKTGITTNVAVFAPQKAAAMPEKTP